MAIFVSEKTCQPGLTLLTSKGRRTASLFVWEVVKAYAATRPKHPKTIHYQGDGQFMVAGGQRNLRRKFKPEMP